MRKSRRTRLPTFITRNHRFAHLQFCTRITTIAKRLQGHVAASPTPSYSGGILLLAVLLSTARHAPLHESSCSSNNLTAAPDGLSACAHFLALSADVMRFLCPGPFFINARHCRLVYSDPRRVTCLFGGAPEALSGGAASSIRQHTGDFVPCISHRAR